MKAFISTRFVVWILLFLIACNKNETLEKTTSPTSIVGSWEMRQVEGSLASGKTYPAGNGNILIFSNSSYQKYTDGNLVKSGQYLIVADSTVSEEVGLVIPKGHFTNRIVFDGDYSSPKTFMEISNNKLTLISGYFPVDGGVKISYEKQVTDH